MLGEEAHEAVGGQREEAVRLRDLGEVLDHEALDTVRQVLQVVLDGDLQEREAVGDRDVAAREKTEMGYSRWGTQREGLSASVVTNSRPTASSENRPSSISVHFSHRDAPQRLLPADFAPYLA